MRRFIAVFFAIFLSLRAGAADLTGYAVKSAENALYLDLGAASGLKPGAIYSLSQLGEEIRHPVSGESLGIDKKFLGRFKILSVEEKYSIASPENGAALPAPGTKLELSLGQEASPTVSAAPDGSKQPSARGPFLPYEAVDLAFADLDGDGAKDFIVAWARGVSAYKGDWSPLASFTDPSTSARVLSVDAADLDGDGRAEIFAVVENKFFKRLETYLLLADKDALVKKESLPFMVRAFYDGSGLPVLGMQKADADAELAAGPIRRLVIENGRYGPGPEKISHKRLDWLYGFAFASNGSDSIFLNYARTERIRLFFKKGSWSTAEEYGQTANRISLKDRELRFSPRLIVAQDKNGLQGVYTLKNVPRFFQMAAAFGKYDAAELLWLRWNGMSLEPSWKAPLSGYAAGLVEDSGALHAAVVGADGRSSVWTFQK